MSRLTIIQGAQERTHEFDAPLPLSSALAALGFFLPHPCGGRGACGKCTVLLNGQAALACRTVLTGDAQVVLPEKEALIAVAGGGETDRLTQHVCLCLDVGTTTLVLALVSLDEKKIIRTVSAPNPQRAAGADVISRIDHCMKHGPLGLQRMLLAQVQAMISALLDAYALQKADTLYLSGNTAMLHLFFGVDCSAMGRSPYTPSFLSPRTQSAQSLGLFGVGTVRSLPGISAFVGADIVAGMIGAGLPPAGKYHLLLDLGTNAEIALYDSKSILCTAAAAGPCFEGANISCGMSASPGAVCACADDGSCTVIGGGKALGLCATGLIDAVALALEREDIDETGRLEEDLLPVCEGVALTQKDIREFQLAKSAIRAAMECLIERSGVAADDISGFFVAGGFSAGLDIGHAVSAGLIPGSLKDKFIGVNNASLLGCVKYACESEACALPLARAQYADLSADPLFAQLFMEYMMF